MGRPATKHHKKRANSIDDPLPETGDGGGARGRLLGM